MQRKWALIIATVLGLLAVFLTHIYFQQREARMRVRKVRVLMAAKDIAKGATIEYDALDFKVMPINYVEPDALTSKEAAVGKAALVTIKAGEQILPTKLVAPGTGLTLAKKTPPGKRAFTISLGSMASVGGMIKPGDHVDVLAIFNNPAVTMTLFQDILILAVGQEMVPTTRRSADSGISRSGEGDVTLALSPQQVQIINVAMGAGKIRLTLRPRMEAKKALPEVNLDNLPPILDLNTLLQLYLGRPKPKEEQVSTTSVEVIRGLKKELTTIPK